MRTLYLILYILAGICFLVAAFHHYGYRDRAVWWGPALVPLGLFFWVLVPFLVLARQ
jgi:hypothetical protein